MGTPIKVMVVDDDDSLLQTVRWTLEPEGFAVVTTNSALCAPMVSREKPHILLVDVNMPALKGTDVVRIIRKHDLNNGLPILLHSSRPETDLQEMVATSGASGYIRKAEDPEAFLREIRFWITKLKVGG